MLHSGSDLAFLVSNKTAFEIPFTSVANTTYGGKEEVTLEFALSQPAPKGKRRGDEELVEMRLHIPGTYTRDGDENGEPMDVDGDDEETSAARAFHDMIKEKADVGEVTGQAVAIFPEVNLLTPRCVELLSDHTYLMSTCSPEDDTISICSWIACGYAVKRTSTRSTTRRYHVYSLFLAPMTCIFSLLWVALAQHLDE